MSEPRYALHWRDLPEGRAQIVLPAESRKLQVIAEKIGLQFRREGHYDAPPYSIYEAEEGHEVALLVKTQTSIPLAVGAVGFLRDDSGTWLEWIWVHPYERGRLLYRAWPELEARYGQFHFRPPISPSMRGFLKAQEIEYGEFGERPPGSLT